MQGGWIFKQLHLQHVVTQHMYMVGIIIYGCLTRPPTLSSFHQSCSQWIRTFIQMKSIIIIFNVFHISKVLQILISSQGTWSHLAVSMPRLTTLTWHPLTVFLLAPRLLWSRLSVADPLLSIIDYRLSPEMARLCYIEQASHRTILLSLWRSILWWPRVNQQHQSNVVCFPGRICAEYKRTNPSLS